MIAKVNGTTITAADVEKEIGNIVAQYQNQVSPEQLKTMMPNIQKQAIETQINKTLLFAEAERNNIQPSPDKIKTEMDAIVGRFPSLEAFEQKLVSVGLQKEQIEKDIEQQIKIDILVGQSIADVEITITEDETSAFYKENPKNFETPEQVQASHILFKFEENDPQSTKDQKRLEMAGLLGRIEKGTDFADMARNHSDCPSKERGGDLGFFERGKMVKAFEKAAFSLKAGELSDIVESPFGYHLIKVTEHKAGETVQYDDVKDQIAEHLKQLKSQESFLTYIEQLRETAEIEYAEGVE
ncbi:MAG: hypothetical protein GY850_06550 [bacterium]|nr:hypothetical protein [bacterium]